MIIIEHPKKLISTLSLSQPKDHQKFGFNLAVASSNGLNQSTEWSLKEIFDGILWHAPRCRRSVETRNRRKFGYWDKYEPTTKLIKKKRNLVICDDCGHWHELENICQICYDKVKAETKFIQESIMKRLGLMPVEKEVAVKYENEQALEDDRYFVEIPKERPVWFSKNLISNSVDHSVRGRAVVSEDGELKAKIDK